MHQNTAYDARSLRHPRAGTPPRRLRIDQHVERLALNVTQRTGNTIATGRRGIASGHDIRFQGKTVVHVSVRTHIERQLDILQRHESIKVVICQIGDVSLLADER